MKRMVPALVLITLFLAAPASLLAQSGAGLPMDEKDAIEAFADKAAARSAGKTRPEDVKIPVGQRPLEKLQSWRRTTSEIFGFSLAAAFAYWIEGKFGKGSNASFHEQVFTLNTGVEAEFTFRMDTWLHGLIHSDFMYHKGSSGVINGINATVSSFSTVSFMIGAKFVLPLQDVFKVDKGVLANTDFYAKLAGGPIIMTEVMREKPEPETQYWKDHTLWGANIALGLELRLDAKFSFFFEHTFDVFSAPNPSSALRPENKAQPFVFYIIQVGWTFYFD